MADIQVGRRKKDKKHHKKTPATPSKSTKDEESWDSDSDRFSILSEDGSVDSQFPLDDTLEDGAELYEDFEGKLKENIEGCRQKGTNTRQSCLLEVQKAMKRRYIGDFLLDRVDTLIDIMEKLIKRGQPRDRILASEIACLFCVQLGEDDSTKLFNALKPILVSLVTDDSISPDEKAAACSALGMSCFVADVEMEDLIECLTALKTAFSKKVPSNVATHTSFASALSAWSLILTVVADAIVTEQIQNSIGVLVKLLELGSLHLRIAAGETVALVYELAQKSRITLQGQVNVLYTLLQEFSNESGRHKGKREKKQQKASFRDILKSVKGNVPPNSKVSFGPEFIEMTSWEWLRRYGAIKESLGPGTNIHLQTNPFVRDVFDLGLPLSKELKETKVSKYEKQLINSATSKVRTQKRNLKRDTKHKASGL